MKRPGIYRIKNAKNGKAYVGQSANLDRRWPEHRYALNKGTHKNPYLQSAWNKHGEPAFEFEIVEEILQPALTEKEIKSILTAREQAWCDKKKTIAPCGYNIRIAADSNLGIKMSEETRAKNSAAHMGKRHTAEARAKIGATQTGRKRSPATRAKIGATQTGKRHTAETRAKIGAAQTGRKASPAARAKNSAAQTGKRLTAETRAKISAALKGIPRLRRRKPGPNQPSFL